MNPDTESFLDTAFRSIQPTSPAIGRVVIEPDYNTDPAQPDASSVQNELLRCLQAQTPDSAALASHAGFELKIPADCKLLKKYVRRITLHADKLDGSWVEVAPPGNWI